MAKRVAKWILGFVILSLIGGWTRRDEAAPETFAKGLGAWHPKEGAWTVRDGRAMAEAGFSMLIRGAETLKDVEVSADVAYLSDEPHAAAGLAFRLGDDATGYAAGYREVEKGVDPKLGPWERPVVQLFRIDRDGWKLLQESKIEGARSGKLRRLKIVGRGPEIWVFDEDMKTPVLKEFDNTYDRPGLVGLWKDHQGTGLFDNAKVSQGAVEGQTSPSRTDWSWVRGAVYVRSNAVNAVQMWHDYWAHTDVIDRELNDASIYGFNMVQVYVHWIVWDRHGEEYLKRVDDFLVRADRAGLKVNLIMWDDCGHVEPSLTIADPVPGRHNSQMMPNPSHRIRDSDAEMMEHKERFRSYVEGFASRFKDDPRVAFWQIYNEGMGPKEAYRQGVGDANLNRLMDWTRGWMKEIGVKAPLTATGGAFYGPKYADFPTYHSYTMTSQPLPNADGGPEHLCTETLNRPGSTIETCLRDLAGKKNGFVVWELMIGRDNCRFPWGHADGLDEPKAPFHGVIYPDGHPWDVGEIRALLGDSRYDALRPKLFQVEYFDGVFQTLKKTSVTPTIDFELGDEPGTGSPDASAGLDKDHFSIRWTGRLTAPISGAYIITSETDGAISVWLDSKKVIQKDDHQRREVLGTADLIGGESKSLRVDYAHRAGPASAHLFWTGPGLKRQALRLAEKTDK